METMLACPERPSVVTATCSQKFVDFICLWAHSRAEFSYFATAFYSCVCVCVSFSVFLTFQHVEVTELRTAIIKPRGTLWSSRLEVSSAAWAISLSTIHVSTAPPRQSRLIPLLGRLPDASLRCLYPFSVIYITGFCHFPYILNALLWCRLASFAFSSFSCFVFVLFVKMQSMLSCHCHAFRTLCAVQSHVTHYRCYN